jgi:succinate-semialdehyde dehydrogenase/glutarate-semialdehyde dehydrogenase
MPPTLFVEGRWRPADSGGEFEVRDPATGETLQRASDGGASEARRAVEAAARAFPAWAALAARERSGLLKRLHGLLLAEEEPLALSITRENGKPLGEARQEVRYAADFIEWAAEEARRVYGETVPAPAANKRILVLRQPVGAVAAITPWNFPLAMVARKLGPALAAGCTVVLKPAEQTPLTAAALFRLLEKVGLPAGVANLVTGKDPEPIAGAMLADPRVRKITFTGSVEVGKRLARGAADRLQRVTLELGGHSPFLVFEDADLERAVEGLMRTKFRNGGQSCICANRAYVQESVFGEFAGRFVERVGELKVGNGLEPGVQIGPLIDAAGLEKVRGHVEDAVKRGGRVLCGGRSPGGLFFEPTVLAGVKPGSRILQEETFGPVIPLIPFRTEEEAVRAANDTAYGLAAYLYTRDLGRAFRATEALEYGIVGLNDSAVSTVEAPFGGMKESGLGREGGRQGIEEFLETKYVSIGL